jgi:alkaline phosphatase D
MLETNQPMTSRSFSFCWLAVALACLHVCPEAQCGEPLTRIAAGSCNRQDLPQPLWDSILKFQPQLWIWLGDNIYGDTDDMTVLAEKWNAQKKNPGYRKLRNVCSVEGIWDDHDYGRNDAGSDFERKKDSQLLILDFLDEPADSPRRRQSGIYASRIFGPEGRRVCLILLDVRTHRDKPQTDGDILGEAQWAWLEKTLRGSTAQIHLICSGSQILPTEHRHEKWSDYPESRGRLLKLIASTQSNGTILLSGDRHFGEVSRLEDVWRGQTLYELTTSGLTHSYKIFRGEMNQLRVGEPFAELNFGTLLIDWNRRSIEIAIRDARGNATRTVHMPF